MTMRSQIILDGEAVDFSPGETILEIARRNGREIPTLCHDPRLDPVGACRTCLVEVEGERRLQPSCMIRATNTMAVITDNERIDRHRKSLLALYMTDHPRRESGSGPRNELLQMVEAFDAPTDWGRMVPVRAGRPDDRNPYIEFRPDACILCARCTRYCEEVEAVSAITLAGRSAETTVATADDQSLLDSTCEMCGGCIDVCPTGAMIEKMPLERGDRPDAELDAVRSTCGFCGVGCQLDLMVDRAAPGGRVVKVSSPATGTTTNDGNLCVKGRFAYDFIHHADRLTKPLIRGEDGELHEVGWDDALARVAAGLHGVAQRHGADALGFVSSSRCTVEENYLVQKLARAVFGTNNVHQCAAT